MRNTRWQDDLQGWRDLYWMAAGGAIAILIILCALAWAGVL